jgi:PKD repeat protein
VNLTDTSRSIFGIASRRWDFGNRNVQSGTAATFSATQTGTFRVILLVTGASGCVDSMIQNILIPVQGIPGINIKGNPILCEGGSNTLEADIVSTDSIASILWDFGNGQQAQGARVTANYVNAGSFTIRLTVRTVFGCTSTITRNVTVQHPW